MEVKAYHALKAALEKDKSHIPELITNPITGKLEPHTHLSLWFKASLVPIIIFAVFVLLVWSFFNKTNTRDRRRSHHGINKFGERY